MSGMDELFNASTVQASDQHLSRISQLVAEEGDTKAELATAEEMVRSAKERLTELYHDRLPAALIAAGTTEFKDTNGIKVALAFAADGALGSPKTAEEFAERDRKLDLIESLEGGAEIIKFTVAVHFPKELTSWAAKLIGSINRWLDKHELRGIMIERQRTIHHQTLKKWVKERMEAGASLPLDDLGMWYGQIAKVQRPKEPKRAE